MKNFVTSLVLLFALTLFADSALASIKYVNGYTRRDGTYVSGHYRDTSSDGNPYNNANYLGYNDY